MTETWICLEGHDRIWTLDWDGPMGSTDASDLCGRLDRASEMLDLWTWDLGGRGRIRIPSPCPERPLVKLSTLVVQHAGV
jgi:hypothetical protein